MMAEVVYPRELSLKYLACIVCRTIHEAATLRHMLEIAGCRHDLPIVVEQRSSVFMRKGIFLDEVYSVDGVVHLSFHTPVKAPQDKYELKLVRKVGAQEESFPFSLSAGKWRFPRLRSVGNAIWRIEIEGCLAFLGPIVDAPAQGQLAG